MTDIHAVVYRFRQTFDGRQIFGKGLPGPVDAGHHRFGRDILDRGQTARKPLPVFSLTRRQGKATIAHYHAGDPVPARTAAERVPGDLRIHMRVTVDEPGGDDQPVGVNGPFCRPVDAADLDDPAALDPDIGAIAGHSRTIHHRTVLDQQVEAHRDLLHRFGPASGHRSVAVNRGLRSARSHRCPELSLPRIRKVASSALQVSGLRLQFVGQPAKCLCDCRGVMRQGSQRCCFLTQETDLVHHNRRSTSGINLWFYA